MTGRVGSATVAAAASLVLAWPSSPHAAPARGTPPPRPSPVPLPAPPVLPLVRVEVSRDHVVVVEDVVVGRGAWRSGDLEAFVAFGAPGLPRAIDAHLFAASADNGDEVVDTWSQPVPLDRAYECPAKGRVLLGPPGMAGVLLHLREPGFRRATEVAGAARIRIRSLLEAPPADVRGGHEIVVRLGSFGGIPDALGAVRVVSTEPRPWVTGVEARLCGPDADPHPLAVQLVAPSAPAPGTLPEAFSPIAPIAAVRRTTDDLCVRYWTTSEH